jgi:hypothetical protein
MNMKVEKRGKSRPGLSDLAGSVLGVQQKDGSW